MKPVRKTILSLTTAVFLMWLLPLGTFIKPSEEKTACGGQRAICMCSHMKTAKVQTKPIESGTSYKGGPSAQKEGNPAGGAGHYFVSTRPGTLQGLRVASAFEEQYLSYKDPFLASLEHVPKA